MLKIMVFVLVIFTLTHASFVVEFEKFKFKQKESATTTGKIWVLLVAGSNGYKNYRHQVSALFIYALQCRA